MRALALSGSALLVAMTASPAFGQASGPRNLAMGGTGVASSDPWSAPFSNPALTRFRDEGEGLSVALPFLSASVRDDQELLDAADEFQDTLDTLQAQINASDPAALVTRSVALLQLGSLNERTVDAEGEFGFSILAPREDYTATLWMRVRAEGRAFPLVSQNDLAVIADPASTAADLDNLESEAVVVAAQRTEVGATFALEGLLKIGPKGRRVSAGITPKIQWIETYNYAVNLDNFEDGATLDDFRSDQFQRSSSAVNFDLGLAAELEEGATVGLSVRDVFRQDFATVTTNGREYAYRIQPRTTIGVAVERAGLSFAADLDLTRTRPFSTADASQWVRMGVEANIFGQAQLRTGFAHDFENGQADILSVGLGISPAETVRLDLVGQFGDNAIGAGLQVALTL